MIKRYNPDISMSISHENAWMRETPEGGHVEYGDYASLFAELESVKAERNTLAVENAAIKAMNDCLSEELRGYESDGAFEGPNMHHLWWKAETPATSAALAAIEARFCGLLDTYGKVEPERFNPVFADLYAKIANRIFSSVVDNPSVTDLESLTDWLESSTENARAYADMSIKFHAEQPEAK